MEVKEIYHSGYNKEDILHSAHATLKQSEVWGKICAFRTKRTFKTDEM